MKRTRAGSDGVPSASDTVVRTLVISQHEAVRQQLVIYLSRSPALVVSGDVFSLEGIVHVDPDVLVLDLSQLGWEELRQAIDTAQYIGARLIALASMREPADERAVTSAGGLYRLKSAGADGLAEVVREVAGQAPVPRGGEMSPVAHPASRRVT